MTLQRLAAPLALLVMLTLAGCVQQGLHAAHHLSASAGALADLATESDESALRRRARLRVELGGAYLQEGQPQVALDELKQAIAIDPTYADAFNLRGLAYLRLNNEALAADSFERALMIDPRDVNASHNLGVLRCQQGRFDDANRQFARASADPDYAGQPRNWIAQALCHASAGKPLLAEAGLQRALSLDADEPAATYHLARLIFERGDALSARPHVLKLNSSTAANAASLWLGIRIERQLNNQIAMRDLVEQLRVRFGQSRELSAFDRGAFHE